MLYRTSSGMSSTVAVTRSVAAQIQVSRRQHQRAGRVDRQLTWKGSLTQPSRCGDDSGDVLRRTKWSERKKRAEGNLTLDLEPSRRPLPFF